ncbi:MAG: epoxyqueuosine reductase QueH [Clostridia bacterium]|nr:epoxyqueuosine reductase QueH [Clostridia bacterium]
MKENYQKLMEAEIQKIRILNKKPRLLLHACCAPCSSAVLEVLRDYFEITIFFYNPNICPKEEFICRLQELKRLLNEMNLENIDIISPRYNGDEFEDIARGLENVQEGGQRCLKCYRLRLEKTAQYAQAHKYDYFTTTLTVSPYKNAEWLNCIGLELENTYLTKYLCSDFKKKDGYKRSCELSKRYGLYRQNYCGCIYSEKAAKEGMEGKPIEKR